MEIRCPKTDQVVQEFKAGPSGLVSRLKSDFEEVEFLGMGGYGSVIRVRNKIDDQYYALKKIKIDPEIGYDYVVREAKAMSKMNHPNVVRYYGAWIEKDITGFIGREDFTDDEYPEGGDDVKFVEANGEEVGPMLCILQELCHGSLQDTIKDLTHEESKSIVKQIVEAVKYIHNEGIAHGDLSPSNLFFNKTKEAIKIGDFGLANLSHEKHERPTTIYRAPELDDPCSFTTMSDMYSLGILILEIFARFTNEGERVRELQRFKETQIWPDSLDNASTMIKDIIKSMTKKDPSTRPTASDILPTVHSI